MKPYDDGLQILKSSPISVLESTRKDFEDLLESANSSNEEDLERKTKQAKRQRFRKQEKHRNSVKEHVELRELSSVQSKTIINVSLQQNLVKVKSHTNPTFWHEDESDASSCPSSTSSGKLKKGLKISSNSPKVSHSSVEHAAIHGEKLYSSTTNSFDDDDSGKILSVAPIASERSRTTISSSYSIKYSKESHKNRKTSHKSLKDSQSLSSDQNIEEDTIVCVESSETLSSETTVLKIVVHQCDRLILDHPKRQPLVVVHAVSCKTGRYIVHNNTPISPQFTDVGTAIHGHKLFNSMPEWNQEMSFEFNAEKYLSEIIFLFKLKVLKLFLLVILVS